MLILREQAQRIADKLQDEMSCINEKIKTEDTGKADTGERLVVVVPTYAWRILRIVSEWMEKTNFVGAKKVWYVMTCGGSVGNADAYNKKLSEQKKFQHMGTAQIVMPENYIAMFDVPTVEEARKTVKAAESDIDKAAEMIADGTHFQERNCKLQDRIESGPVNAVFYPAFVKAKAFMVGDFCIGCGVCVQVVEQILEAGRLTHTAKNAQDVSFIVVDKTKDEIQAPAKKSVGEKIVALCGGINLLFVLLDGKIKVHWGSLLRKMFLYIPRK